MNPHVFLMHCPLPRRSARWSLLLAAALVLTVPIRAQTANLAVDTTKTVRTVDERVFGLNAVMWDSQTSTAETVALVHAAGVHAIRIPGGGMSDDYNWADHTQISTSNNWPQGFDAFVPLITGLDCPTFVTVNYGSGTPQEAAAWVAYANASATLQETNADVSLGDDSMGFDWKTAGYWSALRASAPLPIDDGRNFLRLNQPAPFGLKYWEVGNECYGTWEYDLQPVQNDPVEYGTRFARYFALMKTVDPTIKVGAVATTSTEGPYDFSNEAVTDPVTHRQQPDWDHIMLSTIKAAGVMPDYLICHRYEQNAGQEDDAALLQLASAPATGWAVDAALLRGPLTDYFGDAAANVELCVTESNSVHNNPGKQMTSLVNGLYLADSLGSVLQTEFNSRLWWDLRDGGPPTDGNGHLVGNQSASLYGWRQYGEYGILSSPSPLTGESTYDDAYPVYYVMKLLAHFAQGGDAVIPATTDNPLLSVYAVRRADDSLSLLVINKSPTSTQAANISLTGFVPQPRATVDSYGIPQDTAAETGIGSRDIATENLLSSQFAVSGGNGVSGVLCSFAPYSVSVVAGLQPAPPSPSILVAPAGQTLTPGQNAVFSVVATSNPPPAYQWQRRASGSSAWTDLGDGPTYSGSKTATLTVSSTTAAMNGDSFQCVITNANGAATTTQASLVVNTPYAVATLSSYGAWIAGGAVQPVVAFSFNSPADIALDGAGNAAVADTGDDVIRVLTANGGLFLFGTLAGHVGVSGSGDGTNSAAFDHPAGVAADSTGDVYVADTNNNEVRKVTAAGVVSTIAGRAGVTGSADGTGSAASFNGPSGIVVDATGDLYVADTLNHTIRKVASDGTVTTIAGAAESSGFVDATGSAARFHGPQGLALDVSGNLFVADTNNNAIRQIALAIGAVTTVAGQAGVAGSIDGTGSQAQFHFPSGVAVDATGNLYIADTDNHTLRKIAHSGAVSTLAGLAGSGGSADGIGSSARFDFPTGVAIDGYGTVFVADAGNDAIRLAALPAAPQITVQPQGQTVTAGATASFTITATGKPAPTLQWYFGNSPNSSLVPISGATGSKLTLNDVQASNSGIYTATVTNDSGSVTSNPATLTVSSGGGGGGRDGGGSGGGGGAPSVRRR